MYYESSPLFSTQELNQLLNLWIACSLANLKGIPPTLNDSILNIGVFQIGGIFVTQCFVLILELRCNQIVWCVKWQSPMNKQVHSLLTMFTLGYLPINDFNDIPICYALFAMNSLKLVSLIPYLNKTLLSLVHKTHWASMYFDCIHT